ncbi:MAG: fatty acid desaturase family protein [Paracoccaceae bacterium]
MQDGVSTAEGIALVLIVLLIGTRYRGLNNIVHECSHFSFSLSREDNVFFGRLCSTLILKSFHHYRIEHMSHHAHVGDYEHDEDFKAIQRFRLEEPLTPRTILRHALTPFTGMHVPYYCRPNLSGADGAGWRAARIGLVAAAVLLVALAPIEAAILVWAPYVLAYTAINYWTDCIDHGGLVGQDDELAASRNMVVPKWLRAIVFPRNDCYHLIHHLFPQVPTRHLDACHERLMGHPAYRDSAEANGALFAAVEDDALPAATRLAPAPEPPPRRVPRSRAAGRTGRRRFARYRSAS